MPKVMPTMRLKLWLIESTPGVPWAAVIGSSASTPGTDVMMRPPTTAGSPAASIFTAMRDSGTTGVPGNSVSKTATHWENSR